MIGFSRERAEDYGDGSDVSMHFTWEERVERLRTDDLRNDLFIHRVLWTGAKRLIDEADDAFALDLLDAWLCSHFESDLRLHPMLLKNIKTAIGERKIALFIGAVLPHPHD